MDQKKTETKEPDCGRRNKMSQDSPMNYLLSQNASFNHSWDKEKMLKKQLLIYLVLFNPYGMFNSVPWKILIP